MYPRLRRLPRVFRALVLGVALGIAACAPSGGPAAGTPTVLPSVREVPVTEAVRVALAEQLLTTDAALRLSNAGLAEDIELVGLLPVGEQVFFLAELDQQGQEGRYFGRAERFPDYWTIRELAPPDPWLELPAPLSNEVNLQRLGTVPAAAIAGWVDPTIDRLDIASGASLLFVQEPQDGAVLGPLRGWGLLRAFRRGRPLVASPTGPLPVRAPEPPNEIARAHADGFAERVVLGPVEATTGLVADRMHPELWVPALDAIVRAAEWRVQPNPLPTAVGWIYELTGSAGRARLFVTVSHEPEGWRVFAARYVFLPET
jgi:hypothetical protein